MHENFEFWTNKYNPELHLLQSNFDVQASQFAILHALQI